METTTIKKLFTGFGLVMVFLVVQACTVKPIYNNLDRLVTWQAGDYLALNREQKASLRRELGILLDWHRQSHLILYAELLSGLPQAYSDGVSPKMIEELFDQLLMWGEEIESKSLPMMSDVLLSLDKDQIDHLESQFKSSNAEWVLAEQGESLSDYQRGWAEEIEEGLERFTGRLNTNQRSYLEIKSLAYQPERELWGEYRQRWQKDFFALLRSNDRDRFYFRFVKLVENRESYYGDEFEEVYEANLDLSREAAAHLLSNLTEKQSAKFNKTLNSLSQDFRELAQDK